MKSGLCNCWFHSFIRQSHILETKTSHLSSVIPHTHLFDNLCLASNYFTRKIKSCSDILQSMVVIASISDHITLESRAWHTYHIGHVLRDSTPSLCTAAEQYNYRVCGVWVVILLFTPAYHPYIDWIFTHKANNKDIIDPSCTAAPAQWRLQIAFTWELNPLHYRCLQHHL